MKKTVLQSRWVDAAVLAAVVTVFGTVPSAFPGDDAGTSGLPKPDEGIQTILHSMVRPQPEESAALLDQLKKEADGRHRVLVQQLFLFSLEAKGTREGMLPGVMLEALAVSRSDLAGGLLPLLDVEDERVRGKAKNWLGQVERPGDDPTVDFSVYISLMKTRGEDVPDALVQHMWERDPEAARAALVQAYGDERATVLVGNLAQPDAP